VAQERVEHASCNVDGAIKQFLKQLAWITAAKRGQTSITYYQFYNY